MSPTFSVLGISPKQITILSALLAEETAALSDPVPESLVFVTTIVALKE